MKMGHPQEEMILYNNEEKDDDFINGKEFDFAVLKRSSREVRPVKILKPQWDKEKSYLQLRKENKVTFYNDMPNMKTAMDNNLLTKKCKR